MFYHSVAYLWVFMALLHSCIHGRRPSRIVCNGITSRKQVYFESDENSQKQCKLYIKKFNEDVCQLRLDFDVFSLGQPRSKNNSAYTCVDDVFKILIDPEIQSNIPIFCGENTGQHVYIPVQNIVGKKLIAIFDVKLKYNLIEESRKSNWKIKVTQMRCPRDKYILETNENTVSNSSFLPVTERDTTAPSGCSQYFTTQMGVFESFNFNDGKGPYLGSMKYSICFQRSLDSCGIMFKPIQFQLGYNNNASNFTDRDCDTKLSNYEYIDDYLYIPNAIITENRLQASKYCNDVLSSNKTVLSRIPGPLAIFFNTGSSLSDVEGTQLGFKMKYFVTNQC